MLPAKMEADKTFIKIDDAITRINMRLKELLDPSSENVRVVRTPLVQITGSFGNNDKENSNIISRLLASKRIGTCDNEVKSALENINKAYENCREKLNDGRVSSSENKNIVEMLEAWEDVGKALQTWQGRINAAKELFNQKIKKGGDQGEICKLLKDSIQQLKFPTYLAEMDPESSIQYAKTSPEEGWKDVDEVYEKAPKFLSFCEEGGKEIRSRGSKILAESLAKLRNGGLGSEFENEFRKPASKIRSRTNGSSNQATSRCSGARKLLNLPRPAEDRSTMRKSLMSLKKELDNNISLIHTQIKGAYIHYLDATQSLKVFEEKAKMLLNIQAPLEKKQEQEFQEVKAATAQFSPVPEPTGNSPVIVAGSTATNLLSSNAGQEAFNTPDATAQIDVIQSGDVSSPSAPFQTNMNANVPNILIRGQIVDPKIHSFVFVDVPPTSPEVFPQHTSRDTESSRSPDHGRWCGLVLAAVAAAQLVGRELGVSAGLLGTVGAVMHVVSMAVPIVHGAFVVRGSRSRGESVGSAVKGNWGVIVCMVPLLASLRDFASMRGTDVVVSRERMAVGGHGVIAMMAVAMVCGQGLFGGRRRVSGVQVASSFAKRYGVVPLAYAVLGAAALASKGVATRGSDRGWQKAARIVLPLVSAIVVGVGCGDVSGHSLSYVSRAAKAAGALMA